MRVILVGRAADREHIRGELDEAFTIAGEFPTLAEAHASRIEADAIVMATAARKRPLYEHPLTDVERPVTGRHDAEIEEPLTPREVEVVELLAEGLSNKAIAARLGISDQTVKFHVASICGKLGAANRTDAVRRAVRRGLISL